MINTDFENAIFDWVKAASGFSDDNILWDSDTNDRNQPLEQHIGLKIVTDEPVGIPEDNHTFDNAAPSGSEITLSVRIVKEILVRVSVYQGQETGLSSARDIVRTIQLKAALPSNRARFTAVGASCFDLGRVFDVPQVIDADWEARSYFEARFYASDKAEETTTYIQKVRIKNNSTDEEFEVDS